MAKVTVHPEYRIGEISPRLYGAFLEPIGSMVNGSMYNPKHPTADDKGFRTDFIEALKTSGLPAVRLPGGNFVSGWDWKDSIGPIEMRKANLDLAWHQYVPNDVGHDEYLQWAERVAAEPLYTINLGTLGINDAIHIVEYTNHAGGTYWSDLRAKYGRKDPYGVKVWYLGNETDGPWQIASWEKDPRGYGILAHEVSKAMKWVDGSIETVACASSSPFSRRYPQWDIDALSECYEVVDYISLHHYHSAPTGNLAGLLAGSAAFEDYIKTELAVCDFIKTKLRSKKSMMLSFDEYGSMMRPATPIAFGRAGHIAPEQYYSLTNSAFVRHDPDDWSTRRRPPRGGDMLQALGSASTLLTLLCHADRVKIGCMTGGLGAIAATDRDHVWKSAAHYPFTQLMRYGRGVSLLPSVECDTFDVPGYAVDEFNQYDSFENVKHIQSAAALDEAAGALNVFVLNLDWRGDTAFELDVRGFEGYHFIEQIEMYSEDMDAANTYENPNAILPTVSGLAQCDGGKVSTVLRKLSWNVFRFEK